VINAFCFFVLAGFFSHKTNCLVLLLPLRLVGYSSFGSRGKPFFIATVHQLPAVVVWQSLQLGVKSSVFPLRAPSTHIFPAKINQVEITWHSCCCDVGATLPNLQVELHGPSKPPNFRHGN